MASAASGAHSLTPWGISGNSRLTTAAPFQGDLARVEGVSCTPLPDPQTPSGDTCVHRHPYLLPCPFRCPLSPGGSSDPPAAPDCHLTLSLSESAQHGHALSACHRPPWPPSDLSVPRPPRRLPALPLSVPRHLRLRDPACLMGSVEGATPANPAVPPRAKLAGMCAHPHRRSDRPGRPELRNEAQAPAGDPGHPSSLLTRSPFPSPRLCSLPTSTQTALAASAWVSTAPQPRASTSRSSRAPDLLLLRTCAC